MVAPNRMVNSGIRTTIQPSTESVRRSRGALIRGLLLQCPVLWRRPSGGALICIRSAHGCRQEAGVTFPLQARVVRGDDPDVDVDDGFVGLMVFMLPGFAAGR